MALLRDLVLEQSRTRFRRQPVVLLIFLFVLEQQQVHSWAELARRASWALAC